MKINPRELEVLKQNCFGKPLKLAEKQRNFNPASSGSGMGNGKSFLV